MLRVANNHCVKVSPVGWVGWGTKIEITSWKVRAYELRSIGKR